MSSVWVAPLGTDPEDVYAWKCVGSINGDLAELLGLDDLAEQPYEAHPVTGGSISFSFIVKRPRLVGIVPPPPVYLGAANPPRNGDVVRWHAAIADGLDKVYPAFTVADAYLDAINTPNYGQTGWRLELLERPKA
jgi:hypothetical protein